MEIELIADYECDIGENPLWHPQEQSVYWTDIDRGKIFCFDTKTNTHKQVYQGAAVSGFTVQEDGKLLLFMAKGAVATWEKGNLEYIIKEIPEDRETRFNDVIADPRGRVFCGMCGTPGIKNSLGKLYRIDTDGSINTVLENIIGPNGIGFNLDTTKMYYTDSGRGTIYEFDYDIETGSISNQRIFIKVPHEKGVPDGMTVDSKGYIWSARWDGSAVYQYDPKGIEMQKITFPAKKVSSVTFGGPNYMDMYVTTALQGSSKELDGTDAGALFRCSAGIQGKPEFYSKLSI